MTEVLMNTTVDIEKLQKDAEEPFHSGFTCEKQEI